jgi:AraC-like DNA-binding protein
MLYDTLIFLPFFTCLFWIVFTSLTASRTSTFGPILAALIVMMAYIFRDCCCASPNMPPRIQVYTSILAEFCAPTLIPLIWLYQMRLRGQGRFHASQMLWLAIPAMMGSITLLLTIMAGPDRIQTYQEMIYATGFSLDAGTSDTVLRTYYYTTTLLFRGILVLEALVYVIMAIVMMYRDNLRLRHFVKLFRGERIRVLEIQAYSAIAVAIPFLPKMILTHSVLMEKPWISAMLGFFIATGISLFCFISLFGAKKVISLRDMRSVMRFNYNSTNKPFVVEEMLNDLLDEADEGVLFRIRERIGQAPGAKGHQDTDYPSVELPRSLTSSLLSAADKSGDDNSLLSRFEQLMLHGQAYLEPGLTLGDVAERLHSNKTYVSRLVNITYNLAFPDLINTLRVDHAQQYIILHRNARQNEIATACGFTSASSFNNIFKKVTGMTPKIWLATLEHTPGSEFATSDGPDAGAA